MEILWLDDDSPVSISPIGKVKVHSARTCREAEEVIGSSGSQLSWIIVDLIVPQGGWGSDLFRLPGVNFLQHIKGGELGDYAVAVYSIALSKRLREILATFGADKIFDKSSTSFHNVVSQLENENPRTPESGGGGNVGSA